MIGTFDYQERISECAQWAERAANDQAKLLWKEMERFWRQRAVGGGPKPNCAGFAFAVVTAAAQARAVRAQSSPL